MIKILKKIYELKIIIGLLIVGIIGYYIATFDYMEYKRLSIIENMTAEADNLSIDIEKEKQSLQDKLNNLKKIENCIKANSFTGKVVNCDTLPFTGVVVEVETSSTALPVKTNNQKLLEEENKIKQGKQEEFRGTLLPKDLFYTYKAIDNCYVSRNEQAHFTNFGGYMLATDVACDFNKDGKADQAEVLAPDYLGLSITYKLNKKHDDLLGDYIELYFNENNNVGIYKNEFNKKWIIGHITTKLKDGAIVHTGERIGQNNLTGYTTGYHSHIELWVFIDNRWKNISYTTRSIVLDNKRNGKLDDTVKKGDSIYLTSYYVGDVNQTDNSPNIGRSGKDLSVLLKKGVKVIALTKDIRNLYGIKFGDKITLTGKCSGKYQVEDEMNIRYRMSCISKNSACIKGDIAMLKGEQIKCSGVYSISK